MLTDRYEQDLGRLLRTGLAPSPGWEARAFAALSGVHPRRHPNLLTFIIVAALLLLLAAGVFAAVRYFFVEGTLHFHEYRHPLPGQELTARFFSGDLEWETDMRPSFAGDISAVSGKAVHSRPYDPDLWPPTDSDILVSNPDWSEEINLTEIAGIGGINCDPKWSPDGTMISFDHCDPVEGVLPCRAGFHLWVMNADGSEAHQVIRESSLPTRGGIWSPDGSHLRISIGAWDWDGEQLGAFSTDIWGTDIQALPDYAYGEFSPDGTMVVCAEDEPGQSDGQDGWWNRLVVADADGSDSKVIVEQFIAEADIRAAYPTEDQLARLPDVDFWIGDVAYWAGPCRPVWSPGSDKIAFLAALPFEPDGPFHRNQIEVWVYDLTTDELIRMTDDDVGQNYIIWK